MSWLHPFLFAGMLAAPAPVILPVDQVLRADKLAAHAGLQQLMQVIESDASLVLTIGHAGGEAGSARAGTMRAALVALGLGSDRIVSLPQPLDETILIISLEKSVR